MTEIINPILAGSWTDPETGLLYSEEFDVEKVHEWREWAPNYIAAINAGIYDKWIYEIAAACHRRHLDTNGQSTQLRPNPPVDMDIMTEADIPTLMMLTGGSIKPTNSARAGVKVVEFEGNRYAWATIRGRYFVGPAHFSSGLMGVWFRIEDFDQAQGAFQARIVSKPIHSFSPGQVLTVRFESVIHLFEL